VTGRPRLAAGLLGLLLALLLGLLAAVAGASPAAAHAQLVESDPADGSVVGTAPDAITLTFNEPVRLERARVFAADGSELDVDARSSDAVVTIAPREEVGSGTVVVSWELDSSDGHVVSGAISFSVGAPSSTAPASAGADTGPVATAAGVLAVLAGLVALAGVVLGRRRVVPAAWSVALVAGVLWVPLQTGGSLLASASWLDGALSWRGLLTVVALGGLAVAMSAGRRPVLGLGAVVLVAATLGAVVVGPPDVEAPAAAAVTGPQELTGTLGDGTVTAVVDRAPGGATSLELQVVDAAGTPVAPVEAPAVRLRSADLDLGPLVLTETAPGTWTAAATVPTRGDWTVEVSVRLTAFDNPVASLPVSWSG